MHRNTRNNMQGQTSYKYVPSGYQSQVSDVNNYNESRYDMHHSQKEPPYGQVRGERQGQKLSYGK